MKVVLKPKLRLRKKLETSMKKNNKDTSKQGEEEVTEEIMIEDTMKVGVIEETPIKEEEKNKCIKRKTLEDHNIKRKKVEPTGKETENPETITEIIIEGMISVTIKKKLRLKSPKLNLKNLSISQERITKHMKIQRN